MVAVDVSQDDDRRQACQLPGTCVAHRWQLPTEEEIQEQTAKTKQVLMGVIDSKVASSQQKNIPKQSNEPVFIRSPPWQGDTTADRVPQVHTGEPGRHVQLGRDAAHHPHGRGQGRPAGLQLELSSSAPQLHRRSRPSSRTTRKYPGDRPHRRRPCCTRRRARPGTATAVAALIAAAGHGRGAGAVEDPAVHLQLEERQGLHHPAGQASGQRWHRPAGCHHQRQVRATAAGACAHPPHSFAKLSESLFIAERKSRESISMRCVHHTMRCARR